MSYINPEMQLITSEDQFISLLYYDKITKTQGTEKTEITEEIKDYMILPFIDNKFQLKKIEQKKFTDDIFHLATLSDKRRLIIDENGNLTLKENK